MDIVYIITHMVMAACVTAIAHVSLISSKHDEKDTLLSEPLIIKGLLLIEGTLKAIYKIAMSILITHLK